MSENQDPRATAMHAIRLCRRGILCHAEMWRNALDAVSCDREFLGVLPGDLREFLWEAFAKQPESFDFVRRTTAQADVAAEVERWCRRSPVEPGTLPDRGGASAAQS